MRQSVFRFAACALLAASPGVAAPLIESSVGVTSTAYDMAGFILAENTDSAQSLTAGFSVSAAVFSAAGGGPCPGPAGCFAATASALTDFGANRVRSYAAEYKEHANGITSREDVAGALSLWADEWTFHSQGVGLLPPVAVDIQLDGGWLDWGHVTYEISVIDVITGNTVAHAIADSLCACAPIPLPVPLPTLTQFVPLADGGNPDGSFDASFQLTFQPQANATYRVLATLLAASEPAVNAADGPTVDVFNTASITALRVPAGVGFVSAAGAEANYHVLVPEPRAALLLAAACFAVAICGRLR